MQTPAASATASIVASAAAALGLPPGLILHESASAPPLSSAAEIDWTSVDPHDLTLLHLRSSAAGPRRERQAFGAYHTPPALARVMAHQAVPLAPHSLRELPVCLDPACGCGGLLVEAVRVMRTCLEAGIVAASQSVRGLDRDLASVWMARLAVILGAWQLGATSEELACVGAAVAANIVVRDVLAYPSLERVDCVLMNPPYVRAVWAQGDRQRIRRVFGTATGAFDLHVPFVELALRCLRPGGSFAILTTNKLFAADYASRLRSLLADAATLRRVIDLESCEDARSGALVDQVLLIGLAHPPLPEHRVQVLRPAALAELAADAAVSSLRRQSELLRERWPAVRASPSETRIIGKMTGGAVRPLGSLALVRGGLRGFDYRRCCEALAEGGGHPGAMRVLTPGNIRAYHAPTEAFLRLAGRRWLDPVLVTRPDVIGERLWRLFGRPKVVVKGVGPRPTAAWCPQPSALLVAVWGVWGDEELLWSALALLNSRPVAWLHYHQLAMARIPRGSLRTPMAWVAELPVPQKQIAPLAELACLRFEALGPDDQATLQEQIDAAAARAYDLTDADLSLMAQTPVRPVQA